MELSRIAGVVGRFAPWACGARVRALSGGLLALALGVGVWLALADKPWERGVEAREAKGLAPRVQDYTVSGLWKAGVVNVMLLAGLAATAGLWGVGSGAEIVELQRPGELRDSRTHFIWGALLFAAVVMGAAERLPRMGHSLWNDEAYSLRRYVWGSYRASRPSETGRASEEMVGVGETTGQDAVLTYRPVSWWETVFFNRGANNHILFSALSRLSLLAWVSGSGAARESFSEAAFRFPSLVAGLLSLVALAFLGWVNGAPWAGLGAAWLAAFHPWHIRYSSEGRGYALLLFFLVLAMISLTVAARRDRLRWWGTFAICQTLFMLAFPGAVYDAAALFLAAGIMILWRRGLRGGWRTLARLCAAEVVSAMMFLQIYAPSIPQVRLYLEREIARGSMGWDWAKDIWAHLACALQWAAPGEPGSHLGMGLSELAASQPAAFWFLVAALPCVSVIGLWRAGRRRFEFGALATTGFVAPGLAFAHTSLTGNFLFSWYLIFSLPILCLIWASSALPRRALPGPGGALVHGVVGVFLVAAFVFATAVPRRLIREVPRQPMREASSFVGALGRDGVRLLVGVAGTSAGQLAVYEPRAVVVETEGELLNLLAQSKSSGCDLLMIVAGIEKMRQVSPQLASALEESGQFDVAARFLGLEEMFSYTIFRYRSSGPHLEGGR